MKGHLPKDFVSFVWHFLRPYKRAVILFIILPTLAGFWGPFNSLLIKSVINNLTSIPQGDLSPVSWPAALIVLNFIVFDNFTWRGITYIKYKYQATIKNIIIQETLDHVLGESHQFFQDTLSGRLAHQITTLADNIDLMCYQISLDFIRGASLLILSFLASFYVNPIFCYILVLWFVCFASFSLWMSSRLISLADQHARNESLLSGQLVDVVTNHTNVRLFAQRFFEISRMGQFFHLLQKTFCAKEGFIFILCSVQGAMIALMMGFSIYFLIHLYALGRITVGDFALILGLSMELGHMMWYTMSRVDEFNQAYGKCKQSLSSLMIDPQIQDKKDASLLQCTQGKIEFHNVKFHYKGKTPLFENKSVTIEPGQKVGLVGYSGSGKSTFVNLILRLYDVTEGSILIDGQDIRDVTQDSLHQSISIIPQNPSLFNRTLMENIRYGRGDASDQEVVEAADKAHAHEFIQKHPEGYASFVGERGLKLSGGQLQRIAIARAILKKDALILILDEATSQLDSISEVLSQESLWEVMQDKTTIVIAHRLSTLLHMDRILVFDKGKIIEDGTHLDLLEKGGLYKILWDTQVGGFLGDKQNKDEK